MLFIICVDIFSKKAWVINLKDQKCIIITNGFQKILDESSRKSRKIWVDEGGEFYCRSIKSFLQNNNIEVYATQNEEKSVVAERFIRTVKNNIYKCLTSILKNMHID